MFPCLAFLSFFFSVLLLSLLPFVDGHLSLGQTALLDLLIFTQIIRFVLFHSQQRSKFFSESRIDFAFGSLKVVGGVVLELIVDLLENVLFENWLKYDNLQ